MSAWQEFYNTGFFSQTSKNTKLFGFFWGGVVFNQLLAVLTQREETAVSLEARDEAFCPVQRITSSVCFCFTNLFHESFQLLIKYLTDLQIVFPEVSGKDENISSAFLFLLKLIMQHMGTVC